jgi:hypothetical protein
VKATVTIRPATNTGTFTIKGQVAMRERLGITTAAL